MECHCLCLGPPSSGKTLLLKRLQTSGSTDLSITPTVETVGTNIVPVPRSTNSDSSGKEKARRGWDDKDVIGIREIGLKYTDPPSPNSNPNYERRPPNRGSMAPLWPSYYATAKLIIYVIDSSNLFQVSIATVMLMDMLSHEKLVTTRFLVVLGKKDLTSRKKLNHLKFMMRLDSIVQEIGNRLTVEEVSAITGEGIESVQIWITNNTSSRYRGNSRN